jgi:large subunit ribosomal protein L13
MKSFYPKQRDLSKRFILVDVDGMVLGRVCAKIAHILRGKHKPTFTPGTDCGDHVIVLNSDKICVTGNKLNDHVLYKHTGYVGNMKKLRLKDRLAKDSTEVIERTVRSMLPKGPLGRKQLRQLHVSKDDSHKYTSAQVQRLDMPECRRSK